MPGSVAESRSSVSNYKNDAGAKGSGGGYSLKPSSQSEKVQAGVRRADSPGSEVRLGKLQVAVWLGLALGSIVGSYFVGFFSGRYVGFDAARASSAGEVAKLPAPEAFRDNVIQNPGGVYDKLKSPAVLHDSGSGLGGSAQVDTRAEQLKKTAELDTATRAARIVDEDADPAEQNSRTVPLEDDRDGAERDAEQLFDTADSGGGELIIGSEESLEENKVPSSVRLLGVNKANAPKDAAKETAPKSAEKSASALLDERIASAKAAEKKPESSPAVKKSIPSGYFAQVAAPKKMAEAEAVAAKLKRSGFPVVIESASVAGQNFYRVLVGPEQNKVQADRLVGQLRGESYISGKPFIRKVQ